jgi:hypothetical protein
MQQRYYDPAIGRFLSVDQVTASSGTGANFNRYWYANNNPYAFTDPDGREALDKEHKIRDRRSMDAHPSLAGANGSSVSLRSSGLSKTASNRGSAKTDFYQLPQGSGEGGFYNYGTPGNGAGQYGTGKALSTIFKVGHEWGLSGEERFFGVGNMSLEGGGPFPPHAGHRYGSDIDVRPMNITGVRQGGITWRSPLYDRAGTQRLVDLFRATGNVRVIYFNDPQLQGVSPMRGHDDHMHIGIKR